MGNEALNLYCEAIYGQIERRLAGSPAAYAQIRTAPAAGTRAAAEKTGARIINAAVRRGLPAAGSAMSSRAAEVCWIRLVYVRSRDL